MPPGWREIQQWNSFQCVTVLEAFTRAEHPFRRLLGLINMLLLLPTTEESRGVAEAAEGPGTWGLPHLHCAGSGVGVPITHGMHSPPSV